MKRKYFISNPRYQNLEQDKLNRHRINRHAIIKETEKELPAIISWIDADGAYIDCPFSIRQLRIILLPKYLHYQLNHEKITHVQYHTLLSQLYSDDFEAWYLAFNMIKIIMNL